MKRKIFYLTIMSLCAALLLAGCPDNSSSADFDISQITISKIPAKIPVDPALGSGENNLFKVYLQASDFQGADEPPAAQGIAKIDSTMLQADGTYTVVINLRKPRINLKPGLDGTPNPHNPPGHIYDPDLDCNLDDGPWKGTAKYFSVILSPQDVRGGPSAIWAKGSMAALNNTKENISWDTTDLLNFRDPALAGIVGGKTESILYDILVRDPELTTH